MNTSGKCPAPGKLFMGLSLIGILAFFPAMICLGRAGMDWIVMENNSLFESADYTLCLLYSLSGADVYSFGPAACYSPLAYGFFYKICRFSGLDKIFLGVNLASMSYENMIGLTQTILAYPYQMLAYIIYLILGILLYIYAIDTLNLDAWKKRVLCVITILSVPMMFGALERGNLTLYVAGMCLIAYRWKDSDLAWKREGALLLIALAAGLKFYPAVMGILYLKDKRWKEAIRLIIYGVLFVFLPFIFYGGFEGVKGLLGNLSRLAVEEPYSHRIQFFKGFLSFLPIHRRILSVMNTGFILGVFALFWFSPSHLRRSVYLAAALALYAPNAYRYMLLFFLIPLLVWMEEESDMKTGRNYIYACLFAVIFSIPVVGGILTGFALDLGYYTLTYVELFIYLGAWGLVFYAVCLEAIEYVKKRSINRTRDKE